MLKNIWNNGFDPYCHYRCVDDKLYVFSLEFGVRKSVLIRDLCNSHSLICNTYKYYVSLGYVQIINWLVASTFRSKHRADEVNSHCIRGHKSGDNTKQNARVRRDGTKKNLEYVMRMATN